MAIAASFTRPTISAGFARVKSSFNATEWICGSVIAILIVIVAFGPLMAPYDPNALNLTDIGAAPSSAHWLGTDDTGRDILSRLLVGARPTLLASAGIVLLASVVGTALALFAAWRGRLTDTVISRVLNIIFAFPGLMLAILATAVAGPGLTGPVIALSIAYLPYIARVVRSMALRERRMGYVEASSVQGAGGFATTMRHVLPNVMPLVFAQATISFGYVVMELAAVSYIGLGVQEPKSDWGLMVSQGQQGLLNGQPYQSLFAGAAIVVTVLTVILLGNRMSERWGVEE
ncbi:ABC transporter permease subunit [Gordonia sp. SID5947]|uniref:ABC transporter permease n=1 Tax=Gordonia sp. SID5947 TaxID=2690315 RepID=UPI00136E0D10|nr:ABC transporter permease [Gordonia sp. SID5947]MYR07956.1 ABC transporter permease subunit [Gordonia sp. SID5947]